MSKILIVDDNIMNCKMAKRLLQPLSVETDTAENGKVALEMIQATAYDVVLMDHMMPIMDGVEAVQILRTLEGGRYQNLPVIALTANGDSQTEQLLLEAGMNGFLAKPIDVKLLYKELQKWLPGEIQIPCEQQKEADGDAHTPVEELPVIEGIDVKEGIKNSGGRDFWFGLLGTFYQLIDMKSQKIVECIRESLIRDFTIEVHALKNTARMIGAMELSQEFEQLEQLGNAGDVEEIKRLTPCIMEHYRFYKTVLQPYGVSSNEARREVTDEELLYYLQGITDAMAAFDLDCADAAFAQLEECRIPVSCEALIEDLRVYIADVDIDHIVETTGKMIEILETKEDK